MRCSFFKRTASLFVCSLIIILFISYVICNKHFFVCAENVVDVTGTIDEIVLREKYNSCDYDIVTSNLDQGSTNICWAYATASASETSILKDCIDSNTKDTLRFSPTQIAYRTYNRDGDPLGNTVGVYANDKWNVTGNPINTFLMLSQWCAPVAGDVAVKDNAYENNLYRLLDAELIDSNYVGEYRIKEIKRAIAKYGAVTGSYNNAREVEFYNTKGETSDGISHAITIVGWDDTIPASNFKPKSASQNGGWIIKNSYNSLPYFYLSYDSSIGNVCGFKYANKSEFDYNYFYDNVNEEPMRSENNSKYVANIFTSKKSDSMYDEFVKAVNVATYGNNLMCNVRVYTNLTDLENPESGTLSASGERILEYGGYHTIVLNNLAKIDKGSHYSVVVSVSSLNNGSAYILYSLNLSNDTRYKSSSGWNSANYAGRIKAYTVLQNAESKIDISSASHNNISSQPFTGGAHCPNVQLTINSQQLVKDIDYVISYKNNVNIGTAEIVVEGIGKYTGEMIIHFKITPVDVPIKPNSEIIISADVKFLKDINLPDGWEWENPDFPVNNLTSATAMYVGENKENYQNTVLSISLRKEENSNNSDENDNGSQNDKIPDIKDVIPTIIVTVLLGGISITFLLIKIKQGKRTKN